MTVPGQAADTKISHSTPSDSASRVAIDDSHSNHHATHSFTGESPNPVPGFEPAVLPAPDPAHLVSTEKTRVALLQLGESPCDAFALATLWGENQPSIEHEMQSHLHSDSNSPLLQQLLARLVWHARFFCDEVDDPKAWVATSANLEARRMALQLIKTR